MKSKVFAVVLGAGLFLAPMLFAQPGNNFPAPSPASTLKQRFALTDVEIVYSRPSMKGRAIFGDLVPYDKVWRTGANAATKITFSTAVKLNGSEVPAGTYGLFSIPGVSEWTIIISKSTAQQYNEKEDVVRVKAKPVKLAESVESFTIDINDLRDESATLNISWDKVRVPVKMEADIKKKVVEYIDGAMASTSGNKPYYQAAMFYYDNGLDLQKAKTWIDAAVKQREAFYVLHLQAKILTKLGEKEGAIAAAKRSLELSKEANDTTYVKQNEDLIASLK